jgi:hypothetical protein
MTAETDIYFWTDRAGHAYARLRYHGGHWRAEWGYRQPPGGEDFIQQGKHETSVRDDVVQWMLDRIRAVSPEPDEADRVAHKLHAALSEAET